MGTEETELKPTTKELTWLEAIIKVLDDEKRPLHYSEMPEMIAERGYRYSMGGTPAMTIQVNISKHFKENRDPIIVKVESGTYTLKKFLNIVDEPSPEEKEEYIIQSFGMMWRRDQVHWKNSPDIFGVQSMGALPVNFARQIGVYCLMDGRETIYVGQAFSQPIGERLFQHTKDRLSGRWDRFSWFGLHTVDIYGNLTITDETKRCVSLENMCHTLEAILIEGIEPRQNRKSGNKFSGIEYNQHMDPVLERKHYMKLLDEIKEKLS